MWQSICAASMSKSRTNSWKEGAFDNWHLEGARVGLLNLDGRRVGVCDVRLYRTMIIHRNDSEPLKVTKTNSPPAGTIINKFEFWYHSVHQSVRGILVIAKYVKTRLRLGEELSSNRTITKSPCMNPARTPHLSFLLIPCRVPSPDWRST